MRRWALVYILWCAVAAWPQAVRAQSPETESDTLKLLVGAWAFVSMSTIHDDGSKSDRWGPDVKGILIFDGTGHFAQIITRPKSNFFGARGFSAFGRYSVDPSGRQITVLIKGSSNPDVNEATQLRAIVSLTETELKYVNTMLVSGAKIEAHWRRLK
jgi:hypothetical protein